MKNRKAWNIYILTVVLGLSLCGCNEKHQSISQYAVVWDSPSDNAAGSMPLGNGEIGINVWAEKTGDLFCYVGKTDAWNGNGSLLKVGKVRISISPNPFADADLFEQRLDLQNGEIHINAGTSDKRMKLVIWVDAHNPVIHFDITGEQEFQIKTSTILWRTKKRQLTGKELHTSYGVINSPNPVYVYPDSILRTAENEIVWVHRNQTSLWGETLDRQGMTVWKEKTPDPLIHNTFGGLIKGTNLVSSNANTLISKRPSQRQHVSIYSLTSQTESIDEWQQQLQTLAKEVEQIDKKAARKAHRRFWHDFWQRSWIYVDGSPTARMVSRGYVLQRFISACAGRGNFPQKFNGSLFNVDSLLEEFPYDADFRQWGGPYWLQNTRLIYWPMLQNGDFDMMQPFFRMYTEALPYARAATQRLYDHAGAIFPETMYFWGSYNLDNFGWDTSLKPFEHVKSTYIRYYFSGSLEVAAMMLEYYRYTENAEFARDILIPYAYEIVRFYAEHYPRDEAGKIYIYPSQALETYWDAVNPMPPVVGLRWNVQGILELPEHLFNTDQLNFFKKINKELPAIPKGSKDGKDVFLPAAKISGEPHNHEVPEFYAIFPYRLYGVGKPELERMRNNYAMARVKSAQGWQHYDVNAAFLGIVADAQKMLINRTTPQNSVCRFPAFWGPNWDWIPDQDHGSNIMIALQAMLLQTNGDKLLLFPCWPKDWDVDFKIHAPKNTVVMGKFREGRLLTLNISPKKRRANLIVLE